jgi:hypothetical protein
MFQRGKLSWPSFWHPSAHLQWFWEMLQLKQQQELQLEPHPLSAMAMGISPTMELIPDMLHPAHMELLLLPKDMVLQPQLRDMVLQLHHTVQLPRPQDTKDILQEDMRRTDLSPRILSFNKDFSTPLLPSQSLSSLSNFLSDLLQAVELTWLTR